MSQDAGHAHPLQPQQPQQPPAPDQPAGPKRKALAHPEQRDTKRLKPAQPGDVGGPAGPPAPVVLTVVDDSESDSAEEQYSALPGDLPVALTEYVSKRAARIAAHIVDPPAGTGPRAAHYARLHQRMTEFPKPDLPLGGTEPKKAKGASLFDIDANTAATAVATKFQLARAGNTFIGKWSVAGLASVPAPMVGRRDLQLLSQLSQLLINDQHAAAAAEHKRLKAAAKKRALVKKAAAKGKEVPKEKVPKTELTQEIEAMVVGDCILISANEQWAVEHLCNLDLKALLLQKRSTSAATAADWRLRKERKIADLCSALALDGKADPAALPVSAKKGLDRLVQLETDCVLFPTQNDAVKGILEVLLQIMLGKTRIVRGGTPKNAAKLLKDGKHAGCVIVVDAFVDSKGKAIAHAEQNLVYTALLAGKAEDSAVAGGKRPCTVCWLTLGLTRACGHDVNYNVRPGGYWSGSTYRGLVRVSRQLKITSAEDLTSILVKLCVDGGFTQYVTDLIPSGDPALHHTPVPNLRSAIKHQEVNTDALTQSVSASLPDLTPPSSPGGVPDDVEIEEDDFDVPLAEDERDPLGLDDEDEFEDDYEAAGADQTAGGDGDVLFEAPENEDDELLEITDDDEDADLSDVAVHLQLLPNSTAPDAEEMPSEVIRLTRGPNAFGTGGEAGVELPDVDGICFLATPDEHVVTVEVMADGVSVLSSTGKARATGPGLWKVGFDEFVLVGPYVLSFFKPDVD